MFFYHDALQAISDSGPPGVNFINVLQAAFKRADPECAKKDTSQQCRLALLGPRRLKAARIMLVKLTPSLSCPLSITS